MYVEQGFFLVKPQKWATDVKNWVTDRIWLVTARFNGLYSSPKSISRIRHTDSQLEIRLPKVQ